MQMNKYLTLQTIYFTPIHLINEFIHVLEMMEIKLMMR